MLGKRKKRMNPNSTDTLIGEGSVFEGRIQSEASLRVEGLVTGDIDCKGDVTVGEGGHARSNISARHVTIAGTVTGNITTKGVLTITSTGKLHGNVTAHSLIIAEGGVFEGQSRMHTAGDKAERELDTSSQGTAQSASSGSGSSASSTAGSSSGYGQSYGSSGAM